MLLEPKLIILAQLLPRTMLVKDSEKKEEGIEPQSPKKRGCANNTGRTRTRLIGALKRGS